MANDKMQLSLRVDPQVIKQIDRLCMVNGRSRRDLIEIMITKAYKELKKDNNARVNP